MALIRDIIFKARPKLSELLAEELKIVSLKPVNKVSIAFDPFRDDVQDIRLFSHLFHQADVIRTNPRCIIKTEILSDRSEQNITFELTDGQKIIFKCSKLKALEIFKLVNEHISSIAPRDVLTADSQLNKKGTKIKKK